MSYANYMLALLNKFTLTYLLPTIRGTLIRRLTEFLDNFLHFFGGEMHVLLIPVRIRVNDLAVVSHRRTQLAEALG